jgi:hypothetical protein
MAMLLVSGNEIVWVSAYILEILSQKGKEKINSSLSSSSKAGSLTPLILNIFIFIISFPFQFVLVTFQKTHLQQCIFRNGNCQCLKISSLLIRILQRARLVATSQAVVVHASNPST